MSEMKNEMIMDVATQIADYINNKYGTDSEDLYIEIATFINESMGFMFELVDEKMVKEEK